MKKNNKGFMLVEIVVVTVVVSTIMTSLYVVFNRVYNAYERKSTYSNVDAIYALTLLRDNMIEKTTTNSFLYDDLVKNVETNNYLEITCDINDSFKNFCDEVFEKYNINKVYIVKNTESSLEMLKNQNINQTFKDYIDYLKNTLNFTDDNQDIYSNILVVETYTVDTSDEELSRKTFNKYAYLPGNLIE